MYTFKYTFKCTRMSEILNQLFICIGLACETFRRESNIESNVYTFWTVPFTICCIISVVSTHIELFFYPTRVCLVCRRFRLEFHQLKTNLNQVQQLASYTNYERWKSTEYHHAWSTWCMFIFSSRHLSISCCFLNKHILFTFDTHIVLIHYVTVNNINCYISQTMPYTLYICRSLGSWSSTLVELRDQTPIGVYVDQIVTLCLWEWVCHSTMTRVESSSVFSDELKCKTIRTSLGFFHHHHGIVCVYLLGRWLVRGWGGRE